MVRIHLSPQVIVLAVLATSVCLTALWQTQSLEVFLTLLITYGLLTYNVNCTLVGSCGIWAWISTVFPIVVSMTLLVGFAFPKTYGVDTAAPALDPLSEDTLDQQTYKPIAPGNAVVYQDITPTVSPTVITSP